MDRRPIGRPPALIAVVAAWLLLLSPLGSRPAQAADDLRLSAATTYVLDPEDATVHVTIDITVTNQKPNRVSGNNVTSYYWDRLAFGVQPEASAIRATGSGRTLGVSHTAEDGFTDLTIRLASRLDYRESQHLRVQYDLAAGAPRSDSPIRVGRAFASFYAWAWGDPGRSSVTIVLPKGFEETVSGADVEREAVDGATHLVADPIAEPQEWSVSVDAGRPSQLTRDRLTVPGGARITVHGWPEDDDWRSKVGALIEEGLPVLQEVIGLDWPVDGELGVYEVHTPLLEGYAGVYYTDRDRIEIGEDLDDLTIVHEASHAWFNDALFDGRWITEGLADTYAAEVLDRIHRAPPRPDRPDRKDRAAVALGTWLFPGRITDDATDAREAYGYNTSWYVVSQLLDEIGVEGMQAVFDAAAANETAYRGAGQPELVAARDGWRRFLDLLEELGGSKDAEDLFRTWVIGPSEARRLDDRSDARKAYAALLDAGRGWSAPWLVRSELGSWEFDDAMTAIDAAETILASRDAIAARADALGIEPSDRLRDAYESARLTLDDAEGVATAEASTLDLLESTRAALDRERDPLVTLGLWNEPLPDDHWEAAVRAFEADDAGAAAAEAEAARAALDAAPERGRGRLTTAAGGTAGMLFLGGTVIVLRRRRHRSRDRSARGHAAGAPEWEAPYATLPAQPPAPGPAPEPASQPWVESAIEPSPPDQGGSDHP